MATGAIHVEAKGVANVSVTASPSASDDTTSSPSVFTAGSVTTSTKDVKSVHSTLPFTSGATIEIPIEVKGNAEEMWGRQKREQMMHDFYVQIGKLALVTSQLALLSHAPSAENIDKMTSLFKETNVLSSGLPPNMVRVAMKLAQLITYIEKVPLPAVRREANKPTVYVAIVPPAADKHKALLETAVTPVAQNPVAVAAVAQQQPSTAYLGVDVESSGRDTNENPLVALGYSGIEGKDGTAIPGAKGLVAFQTIFKFGWSLAELRCITEFWERPEQKKQLELYENIALPPELAMGAFAMAADELEDTRDVQIVVDSSFDALFMARYMRLHLKRPPLSYRKDGTYRGIMMQNELVGSRILPLMQQAATGWVIFDAQRFNDAIKAIRANHTHSPEKDAKSIVDSMYLLNVCTRFETDEKQKPDAGLCTVVEFFDPSPVPEKIAKATDRAVFSIDLETTGELLGIHSNALVGVFVGDRNGKALHEECISTDFDCAQMGKRCWVEYWIKQLSKLARILLEGIPHRSALKRFYTILQKFEAAYQLGITSNNPSYDLEWLEADLMKIFRCPPLHYSPSPASRYRGITDPNEAVGDFLVGHAKTATTPYIVFSTAQYQAQFAKIASSCMGVYVASNKMPEADARFNFYHGRVFGVCHQLTDL